MTEGLDANLVLSGATLATIAGVAVKLWQASRTQKIGPQPFEVKPAPASTPEKVCDERHIAIQANSENLFCRMSAAEQRIARVESTVEEIRAQYHSIDARLNELLRRLP
jgi:hypothetical protein